MTDTYADPDYLPWLLAYDYNFLPQEDTKAELWDTGGDVHMVLLANYTIPSNCLIIYEQNWGDFTP